jgi:hypothetical protein
MKWKEVLSIRFVVLLAVIVKSAVFWDVMACCLVEIYQLYSETLVNIYQTAHRHIPEDGTPQV